MKTPNQINRILMLFCLIFLTSCTGASGLSLSRTMVKHIQGMETVQIVPVSGTIQISQQQNQGKQVVVLSRYQARSNEGDTLDCFNVASASRKLFVWSVIDPGGGTCSEDSASNEPISIQTHSGTGWQAVYGEVSVPEITRVEVTWEDGVNQSSGVLNQTYLAVRANTQHSIVQIQALGEDGKLIYEYKPNIP
ncbi:MAG: hypothetical protein ABFD44_01335 [Anaerolineaceae bacterium]